MADFILATGLVVSTLPQTKTHKRELVVNQSNELTEAAYYLPLQAKRVVWMCLAEIPPFAEKHSNVFHISVADYSKTFGVSLDTAGKHVKQGVTQLLSNPVWFYRPEDDVQEEGIPWLYKAGNRVKKGVWSIIIHPEVINYMLGLKQQYTSYNLLNCGELKNPRHIRLYESLSQYKKSGFWTVTPEWLCDRYMLPASQRNNVGELKRRFLDPALKSINTNTPLEARYKTTTVKGKITRFEFIINVKKDLQVIATPGVQAALDIGDKLGASIVEDLDTSDIPY